jgi:hypothetical protein
MVTKAEHLTQDFIHGKLDASSHAVEAALLAIYERQTQEERCGAYSIETNGVGFSKFDADFCTSLVEQLKRGRHLTERQLPIARRKMKRYWRQLVTCMTTEVGQLPPVVRNDPIPAPMRNVERMPTMAAPVVERESELFGTW